MDHMETLASLSHILDKALSTIVRLKLKIFDVLDLNTAALQQSWLIDDLSLT